MSHYDSGLFDETEFLKLASLVGTWSCQLGSTYYVILDEDSVVSFPDATAQGPEHSGKIGCDIVSVLGRKLHRNSRKYMPVMICHLKY